MATADLCATSHPTSLSAATRATTGLALLTLSASAIAQTPVVPIGMLPNHTSSNALGISADGTVIYGTSTQTGSVPETRAFILPVGGKMEPLGDLGGGGGGATFALPRAASADGAVIVGRALDALGFMRPFRWTRATGMHDLGHFGGINVAEATSISTDGQVIAGALYGATGTIPWRWTASGGGTFQQLGTQFGVPVSISAAGDAIAIAGGVGGLLWNQATGILPIPLFNFPPVKISGPVWLSPDGTSIIGTSRDPTGDFTVGFKWSEASGFESLLADQQWLYADVDYASPDGSLVLGIGPLGSSQRLATGGVEYEAIDYLQSRGADVFGWQGLWINGVSQDLRTFVGVGLLDIPAPPGYSMQGWILQLPGSCYANCDNSTNHPILNVDDFTCFINQFAAAQALPPEEQIAHYANCDNSTTIPILNIDDFTCFINAFAAGCP